MTEKERQLESLLLVGIGRLFNEQSTYLIGELKHQTKMDFNIAVNAINTFVKGIENRLNDADKEFLEELTDCMHNGLADLRKDILSVSDDKQ